MCLRTPSAAPCRSRRCHAGLDQQRRRSRRHFCRGVRHARDRAASSRPTRALGAAGGGDDDRLCHLHHRLRRARRRSTRELAARDTPDGRPGVRVLLFAGSTGELQKQLQNRVGQCVLTSPGSACYAGLDGAEPLKLGDATALFRRWLADFQALRRTRYWRIPVMDGEFVCEGTTGLTKERGRRRQPHPHGPQPAADAARGRSGGGGDRRRARTRSRRFPGGIVRSGSKVGSKYKALPASTNDALLPDAARRGANPRSIRTSRRCWKSSSTA